MRVTIDGWRLAPGVLDGSVHSGIKSTIKVHKSPELVWNGNPYCEPGTVLYLPGYPGTGATIRDFSSQGNHGTITDAIWTRLSSGLWTLDFNGTSALVDFGAISIKGAGQTVTVWAKADSLAASPGFIGRDGAVVRGWYLGVYLSKLRGESVGVAFIAGGTTLVIDNWYHVVWVWNGTHISLYLNGVSDATPVACATLTDGSDVLGIGRVPPYVGFFDGIIALPSGYNRALSALEINRHYQKERHLFGV